MSKLFLIILFSYAFAVDANQQMCISKGNPISDSESYECCEGLSKNYAGLCDTTPYNDPALKSCSSGGSECTGGTGCYPQTIFSFFNNYTAQSSNQDSINLELFENDLSGIEQLKNNESVCVHSRECKSYNCVSGYCKEKNVCRFAGEGEIAYLNVKCGPDLVMANNGLCQQPIENTNITFNGLMEDPWLNYDDKCQLQMDETTILKSKAAIMSLRAMEWLFSTINVESDKECLGISTLLKKEVGEVLQSKRSNIIKNFSDVYFSIENDMKSLIEANEYYNEIVSSNSHENQDVIQYNGKAVSKFELGSRLSSGYDSIVLIYRKNLLFQSYEKAMIEILNEVKPKIANLSEAMNQWGENDKFWNLGSGVYDNAKCKGSRYLLNLVQGHFKKLKKRFARELQVNMEANTNSSILNRPAISHNLDLISGKQNNEFIDSLKSDRYFILIDPLTFGGVKFTDLGEPKNRRMLATQMGYGSWVDYRKKIKLNGMGDLSLSKLREKLRENVISYYKTNLGGTNDIKKLVFEPELVKLNYDCLPESKNGKSKCEGYDQYFDYLVDYALSFFIAYSFTEATSVSFLGLDLLVEHKGYRNYFKNANSMRRRFLARLEVDLFNLNSYYQKTVEYRNKLNNCYENLANNLQGNILDSDGGIIAGNYSTAAAKGEKALRSSKLDRLTRKQFSFDLNNPNLSNLLSNTQADSSYLYDSDSSAGANFLSSNSSSLAVRLNAMKNANVKAAKAGINVEDKNKRANEIIKSLGKGTIFSTNGSSNNLGSISALGSPRGTQELGAISNDSVSKEEVTSGISLSNPSLDMKQNAAMDMNLDLSSSEIEDSTGLDDTAKEKILESVENNKADFTGDDEDEIFSLISKAYARNLKHLLVKKKNIETEIIR